MGHLKSTNHFNSDPQIYFYIIKINLQFKGMYWIEILKGYFDKKSLKDFLKNL
jgi:hypothetical protein